MLHFLLEIIIMTRSTKTRLLLRDKCKVIHSDRLYRPGAWCMVRGGWCMVYGAWCMVGGAWRSTNILHTCTEMYGALLKVLTLLLP